MPGSTDLPPRREYAFPRSTPELDAGAESRTRWRARYDEVRHRHAGGGTLLGIARAMELPPATLCKYAAAFPARLLHGAGPSLLYTHPSYLVKRIGYGCENAMALCREIQARISWHEPTGASLRRWTSDETDPVATQTHQTDPR